jgi:hypothetical protein
LASFWKRAVDGGDASVFLELSRALQGCQRGSTVEIDALRRVLPGMFRLDNQEDAHELFVTLVDLVREELLGFWKVRGRTGAGGG